LIQSLREQSLSVVEYKPEIDKRSRAIARSDLFASGSILLPQKAAWLESFIGELLGFPGRHDDKWTRWFKVLPGGDNLGPAACSWARWVGFIDRQARLSTRPLLPIQMRGEKARSQFFCAGLLLQAERQ
jgi:hypothetical protein